MIYLMKMSPLKPFCADQDCHRLQQTRFISCITYNSICYITSQANVPPSEMTECIEGAVTASHKRGLQSLLPLNIPILFSRQRIWRFRVQEFAHSKLRLHISVCLLHPKCYMFMNPALRLMCHFLCIILNGNEFFRDLITTSLLPCISHFFSLAPYSQLVLPCYFKIYRGLMGNPGEGGELRSVAGRY
jgi:hypothetical protein